MLSRALTRFLSLVARTFFRRIEVVGSGNIPEDGAVIFAGNHPNALVDGLLLISQVERGPIHFLGNAKLWKVPLLSRVLDALGAVPVYPRKAALSTADNQDAFRRVHEKLSAEGCVAIFPEGISHTESQLTTLKTGAARMALQAAARAEVKVTIIPFGLTYVNRHRFRSQALLQFGAPMVMDADRLSDYQNDEYAAVKRRTGLVVLLLPLAVPGAIILLPVAWLAATVGAWFSYDFDDIATLKVATAVLLLLLVYLSITVAVGLRIGWGGAVLTAVFLPASFFATLFVLERQAQLLASVRGILRFASLGTEIGTLQARREELVKSVRTVADNYADPGIRRMFDAGDFRSS